MKSALLASIVFLLIQPLAASVRAEPVPLTRQELWDGSDAVVIVDVVRLTRTDLRAYQGTPVFIAELRVAQSLKGRLMVGSVLVWHVSAYEAPPGGSGNSLVYPGDRARLYLRRSPAGTFDSWNDAGNEWMVKQNLSDKKLPHKVGESIRIIGTGRDARVCDP